jgi:hypothetical protein
VEEVEERNMSDAEFYEQDRIIYEVKPIFSVWQPELGHLPYVNIRFEKGESEKSLDLLITVGGGAFGTGDEPEDIAAFLRDVADMITEVEEEVDAEDPDNWD